MHLAAICVKWNTWFYGYGNNFIAYDKAKSPEQVAMVSVHDGLHRQKLTNIFVSWCWLAKNKTVTKTTERWALNFQLEIIWLLLNLIIPNEFVVYIPNCCVHSKWVCLFVTFVVTKNWFPFSFRQLQHVVENRMEISF